MTAHRKRQRTICLNMIVKDESRVIRRCLDTVRPWIDHWVIVDTGSTDGTQDIIREHLKDIPGKLHERPWKNFGHNRTEALGLAKGKADYLLLCDADMSLEMSDPAWKSKLDADADLVTHRHGDGGLRYRNIRLVNARLTGGRRWCYRGSTHEYCDSLDPGKFAKAEFDGIDFLDHDDGGTKAAKYKRDAALLEGDLKALARLERKAKQGPLTNELKEALDEQRRLLPRTLFYLGETYAHEGAHLNKAIRAYRKRAALGGWPQEVFYAEYQIGRCMERQEKEWKDVQDAYLRAYQTEPTRAESLLRVARHYNQSKQHQLAYLFSALAKDMPLPDGLFVEASVYQYEVLDEHAVAAYWTGRHEESATVCRRLLEEGLLPESERPRVIENLNFALGALGRPSYAE